MGSSYRINARIKSGMAQRMIFETAAAPPFMKNGFVLGCPRTREGVIVDPGDEVDDLVESARRHGLRIVRILLTHAHLDHITGVAAAKRAFDVPVFLHKDDEFLYNAAVQQGLMFGFRVEQPPPIDVFYGPGVDVSFGDVKVDVLHTPGHCPGGVCLAVTHGETTELIVGDTLFAGSIGRTDLPGGDYETLIHSIRTVLFAFPDDTPVHSGHGPVTTIGQERRTNPFLTGA
jgi:glyoxylase-like metal-dependent hydrolase (beta-lactamase superfamily II)